MTSVFRIIDRNFDPPATVRNVGVRPSEAARGLDIASVDAGLVAALAKSQRRHRAQLKRARALTPAPSSFSRGA